MKNFLKSILLSLIIFILLSIITYQNKLHIDGYLSCGLPYRYYEVCGDCLPINSTGFSLKYFLLDYFIIFTLIYSLFLIIKLIKK